MKFEKDAKKTGTTNLIVGLVVLGAVICLQLFFFGRAKVPVIVVGATWFICLFVVFIFLWQAFALLKSGGKWEVRIDVDGIFWASPNESVDKSFDFKLAELERTETRTRRRRNGSQTTPSPRYSLITKSGNTQKLSPNSGINLVQVITELERLGIPNESIRE